MAEAWLQRTDSDSKDAIWKLDKTEFFIGRSAPSDLIIDSERISRQHGQIKVTATGVHYLQDLNSQNGTFVNGRLLDQIPHQLNDGDEIVFGGVAAFRFFDPNETRKGPRIGRLQGVWIDEAVQTVWVDARLVDPPLSPAQFTLLETLYQRADQIVSRDEIITAVWPDVDPSGVSKEAIDGLIKRLRQRLRQTQPKKEYIQVIRGHGLRLNRP